MRQEIRKSILASFVAGVLIFLLFFLVNGGFTKPAPMLWANGATVTGMLLLLVTFFRRMARTGYFDYVAYFVYMAKFLLKRNDENYLNYYDYKSAITYNATSLWGCVAVSCAFLLGGAILSILR